MQQSLLYCSSKLNLLFPYYHLLNFANAPEVIIVIMHLVTLTLIEADDKFFNYINYTCMLGEFIRHRRSENSPITMLNSPTNV